mmetsp:Transcript_27905/g.67609  ORF Transcript_27905/g.67609 Transcript_27905/m.67609 type:complete len:103 (+) Transcript_27905:3978-4286(+)
MAYVIKRNQKKKIKEDDEDERIPILDLCRREKSLFMFSWLLLVEVFYDFLSCCHVSTKRTSIIPISNDYIYTIAINRFRSIDEVLTISLTNKQFRSVASKVS